MSARSIEQIIDKLLDDLSTNPDQDIHGELERAAGKPGDRAHECFQASDAIAVIVSLYFLRYAELLIEVMGEGGIEILEIKRNTWLFRHSNGGAIMKFGVPYFHFSTTDDKSEGFAKAVELAEYVNDEHIDEAKKQKVKLSGVVDKLWRRLLSNPQRSNNHAHS